MKTNKNEFQEFFSQINREKFWNGIFSFLIILLGLSALFAPLFFFNSVLILIGLLILIAGFFKIFQTLPKLLPKNLDLKNFLINLTRAGLDIFIGIILLRHPYFSINLIVSFLGLFLIIDGFLQLLILQKNKSWKNKIIIITTSSSSVSLGTLAAFHLVEATPKIIGGLIGFKLILFGLTVFLISFNKKIFKNPFSRSLTYKKIPKIPGMVYAAYFGGGFHTGIYVGNDEIVHFRADNKVTKVKWQNFLEGRTPQIWDYPDIKKAPTEIIINTALSLVGKKLPYKIFTNNCEHFAIYCLSGGKTTKSIYAQNFSALSNLNFNPFLGSFVEFYLRFFEWLIFKIGGKFGKKISLRIRKMAALITLKLIAEIDKKSRKKILKTSLISDLDLEKEKIG
jgi:uncharacterized membrane protein HdeD (DUF308 family)